MKTSDNYGLNLVEGTDLVNPLVQDVPNYETIDEVMYENACNSIPLATELKSGTVHALTRSNPDASMFRFIATSKYEEGDTFTVDGVQVSGLLTDGTTLSDGAYVINANVLCCLVGTVLTLFTVPGAIQTAQNALKLGGELPSYYGKASDVQTATNTANAAGTLATDLNNKISNLIQGTLVAGQTSLTLTDTRILTSSIIDPYFWATAGVPTEPISFNSITVNNGSVVMEFDSMDSNINVAIRVL